MMIVVHSRRAAAQEADRLLETALAGPLASRALVTRDIVTLRELVERGAAALPSAPPVLRGPAFSLFVDDLLKTAGAGVRALFGSAADAPGATRAIAASISEARMAGLTAAQVEAAAGETRGASRRLSALADILGRYEESLGKLGAWDDARLHQEVTARLRSEGWPQTIDTLVIRGLYDVTPLQGELLTALAETVPSGRVEIPFDPYDEAATAYAFPYMKMWEQFDDPGRDVGTILLRRWEDESRPEVAFAAAIDPADEARRAADWISERADSESLEEIGVVLAGGARLETLARELRRRGVPFHARRATPLAETPLFAALLLPFRLFEDGFRRADLMAWVTSPLTTKLDPDLLRPVLAAGPAGGGTLGEWRRVLRAAQGESAAVFNAALGALTELARGEASPARFWSDYEDVLSRVGLSPSDDGGSASEWEAWEAVMSELREALERRGAWEAPPASWRGHRRQLALVLSGKRVSVGRTGHGVAILTPPDARGLRFRHTVIVGLVQGSLLSARASSAILGDDERAALNEALGGRPFRLAAEDAREGSLLLRERLEHTAESALLMYPSTDGDGNPLLPALELESLRKRLGGRPTSGRAPDRPWRLERSAERVVELQGMERLRTAFFARAPVLPPSRHDGAFREDRATRLRAEFASNPRLAVWSASRLETARQCPHQFFQRYLLGLEPPDALPLEAEPSAIGRAVHAALQVLYEKPGIPDRDAIDAAMVQVADHPDVRVVERGHPLIWKAALRRAAAVLHRYFQLIEEKHPPEGFHVAGREIEFGPGTELANVTVATSVGPVELRGRLDRLDHDPGAHRLRVVDYKYSKADRHRRAVNPDACGATRFQLYAYMFAARAWAEREALPPIEVLEGVIHCLREPAVLKTLPSPGAEAIERSIAAVIEEAARAHYDPTPADPDECRFCDFRRSCRISTVAGPLPAGILEDEP